jgi:hypothetical protein
MPLRPGAQKNDSQAIWRQSHLQRDVLSPSLIAEASELKKSCSGHSIRCCLDRERLKIPHAEND